MTVDQGPGAGDMYGHITCKEEEARLYSPVSSLLIAHAKQLVVSAVVQLILLAAR